MKKVPDGTVTIGDDKFFFVIDGTKYTYEIKTE